MKYIWIFILLSSGSICWGDTGEEIKISRFLNRFSEYACENHEDLEKCRDNFETEVRERLLHTETASDAIQLCRDFFNSLIVGKCYSYLALNGFGNRIGVRQARVFEALEEAKKRAEERRPQVFKDIEAVLARIQERQAQALRDIEDAWGIPEESQVQFIDWRRHYNWDFVAPSQIDLGFADPPQIKTDSELQFWNKYPNLEIDRTYKYWEMSR